MKSKWLKWSRSLQAIAQTGIHYANHPADTERYKKVRDVAAEIIIAGSNKTVEYISGIFEETSGYATPQVTVRGAVFRDDKILLVKERRKGRWTFPGGYAEVNESPSQSIVREIKEETGFQTEVKKLIGVYDNQNFPPFFHRYVLFFQCEILSGVATTSEEIEEVAFYNKGEVSTLATIGDTSIQISRLYEHYRNPTLPAEFD